MADDQACSDEIHQDPNFAVICSFIEHYGSILGLPDLSFADLERYLSDTRGVNRVLKDLFLKLLRRWKSSVNADRWEKYLIKYCASYKMVDAWELEEFGFQRIKISTKLRILKNLLETQFDCNSKFKEKINEKPSAELRYLPLGRDVNGLAYWFILDKDFNVRIYREEQDDIDNETWEMVVGDRNSLETLIAQLKSSTCKAEEKSRSATPSTVGEDIEGQIKVENEESKDCSEVPKRKLSIVKEEEEEGEEQNSKTNDVQKQSDSVSRTECKSDIKSEQNKDNCSSQSTNNGAGQCTKDTTEIKVKKEPPDIPQTHQSVNDEPDELKSTSQSDVDAPIQTSSLEPDSEEKGDNSKDGEKEDSKPVCNEKDSEKKSASSPHAKDASPSVSLPPENLSLNKSKEDSDLDKVAEPNSKDTALKNDRDSDERAASTVDQKLECNIIGIDESSDGNVNCEKNIDTEENRFPIKSPDTKTNELVTEPVTKEQAKDASSNAPSKMGQNRSRTPDGSPKLEANIKEDDSGRKRKRGLGRKSESEAESVKSESDLSESDVDSNKDSDAPPSKKRRDRSRKTRAQRDSTKATPNKRVEKDGGNEKSGSSPSDGHSNSVAPDLENVEGNATETCKTSSAEELDKEDGTGDKQSGSDKENKKRGRGVGVADQENAELELEPTAKKGRAGRQSKGRGRGRGRAGTSRSEKSKKESESEEEAAPPVQLRRSARANKGQRVIQPIMMEPVKKRKSKKEKEEEERAKLREEKAARKEARRKRKEEKEAKAIAKKKKRLTKESDDEFVPGAKKGKRKKKASSDSEESDSDTDEELFQEEEEEESLKFSSSASSESSDSDAEEYIPSGRNAKRAAARQKKAEQSSTDGEDINDDTPCKRCGLYNHPDLILLCDKCDAGYHTACLRPPLMIIPDGDWFCPPCEHEMLIEKLSEQLKHIDNETKQHERLLKRRERLAFVGISLDNILPEKEESDPEERAERERKKAERQVRLRERERQRERERRRRQFNLFDDDEDEFESSSESSETDEEEEEEDYMTTRRSRRQKKEISYKFEEFDSMIYSAIEEDVKTGDGAGMNGKGKNMDAIISQESEEDEEGGGGKNMSTILKYQNQENIAPDPQLTKPARPAPPARSRGKDIDNLYGIHSEDEENGRPLPVSRRKKKKRGRRLTALDSDEDPDEEEESEEYKASDDEPPSDVEDENVSEYDGESDEWLSISRKKRRSTKSLRRSRRNRRRKLDDDFVVDEYDSEDERESLRTTRRSGRKKISYREDSSEESAVGSETGEESSDASYYSNKSWEDRKSRRRDRQKQRTHKRTNRKRVMYSDDDEYEFEEVGRPALIQRKRKSSRYEEDSDFDPSDDTKGKGRRSAARKVNYRDTIGSESDNQEEDAPKKRVPRKNILKSSDESGTDEYYGDEGDESEKGNTEEEEDTDEEEKVEERNITVKEDEDEETVDSPCRTSKQPPCVGKASRKHGSRPFPKKVTDNVQCSNGLDVDGPIIGTHRQGNSNSNCNNDPPAPNPPNGGFMIENLLKETKPAVSVEGPGMADGGELDPSLPLDDGEDSLSDVDDLVSYVTQE